jgi:hypothetical protein
MRQRVGYYSGAMMAAIFASVSVGAYAEPLNPISESHAHQLQTRISDGIDPAKENILQMAQSLDSRQKSNALEIVSDATDATESVGTFLELAIIYQRMTCADDKAEVIRFIPAELQHSKNALDDTVKDINMRMTVIASAAVLSEAQRMRDVLQGFRLDLDKYQY